MPMVIGLSINFFTREIVYGAPSTQWWTELSSAIAGGLVVATATHADRDAGDADAGREARRTCRLSAVKDAARGAFLAPARCFAGPRRARGSSEMPTPANGTGSHAHHRPRLSRRCLSTRAAFWDRLSR